MTHNNLQGVNDGTPSVVNSRQILVNGQQSSALIQAIKGNLDTNQLSAVIQPHASKESNQEFVVTPDYIQQSMFQCHPSVIVSNPNCIIPIAKRQI